LWERYQFREKGSTLNLNYRLHKTMRQRQTHCDEVNMDLTDNMRERARKAGILTDLDCPLANYLHTKNLYNDLDPYSTTIPFYSDNVLGGDDGDDGNDIGEEDDDDAKGQSLEELQQNLTSHLHNIDSIHDIREDVLQDREFQSMYDGDFEEFEQNQASITRQFKKMKCIAVRPNEIADPQRVVRNDVHHVDDFQFGHCLWRPLKLIAKHCDWNFGKDAIRLNCAVQRGSAVVKYRLTWKYHYVYRISATRNDSYFCIGIKFAHVPLIEALRGRIWVPELDPSNEFVVLRRSGSVGVFDSFHKLNWVDIKNLLNYWRHFTDSHLCNWDDWRACTQAYSDEECKSARSLYQAAHCPLLGDHSNLKKNIDAVMRKQRLGGGIKCLSCNKTVGWFDKHSICLEEFEEVDNVTSQLLTRYLFGRFMSTDVEVREHDDPLHISKRSPTSDAYETIQKSPHFWGLFLHKVFVRFVHRQLQDNEDAVYNCRDENGFKQLSMHLPSWMCMLNGMMEDTIACIPPDQRENVKAETAVMDLFKVLSQLFIMPKKYGDLLGSTELVAPLSSQEMQEIFLEREFAVRLKCYWVSDEICDWHAMMYIWTELWAQITIDPQLWTFIHKL